MKVKKQKKVIRSFLCDLLGNMTFIDRVKFAFSGNYIKPLQKTMARYNLNNTIVIQEPTAGSDPARSK